MSLACSPFRLLYLVKKVGRALLSDVVGALSRIRRREARELGVGLLEPAAFIFLTDFRSLLYCHATSTRTPSTSARRQRSPPGLDSLDAATTPARHRADAQLGGLYGHKFLTAPPSPRLHVRAAPCPFSWPRT